MDNKKNIPGISELIKYYDHIDSNLMKNFSRSIPFQDSVFDREERAKKLNFGEQTTIYNSSFVFGKVRVGKNTWIGPNTILDGSGGDLEIGDFCSISSGVQIYTHDTVMWALSGGYKKFEKEKVKIGHYNYIGSLSIINLGVNIGNQCVIGANSFVNCNIPDRSIFAGSPAKKIGEVVGEKDNLTLQYSNNKG